MLPTARVTASSSERTPDHKKAWRSHSVHINVHSNLPPPRTNTQKQLSRETEVSPCFRAVSKLRTPSSAFFGTIISLLFRLFTLRSTLLHYCIIILLYKDVRSVFLLIVFFFSGPGRQEESGPERENKEKTKTSALSYKIEKKKKRAPAAISPLSKHGVLSRTTPEGGDRRLRQLASRPGACMHGQVAEYDGIHTYVEISTYIIYIVIYIPLK